MAKLGSRRLPPRLRNHLCHRNCKHLSLAFLVAAFTTYIHFPLLLQGDFSERIESLPDEQVKQETLSVLSHMFPNITIPEPTDFFFPRWYTSPLFRGSYSNIPAAFVPAHQQNLRATVEERLWFAGEATSEAFFGRLFFVLSGSS